NIQTGTSSVISFANQLITPASTSFNLKAWVSNVNGAGLDLVRQNDTVSASFCTTLNNPNYTIGGTGADFANLQEAFNQISCGGISGNVSLTLMQSDTGAFSLGTFASTAGSVLTITAGLPNVSLSNAGSATLLSLSLC